MFSGFAVLDVDVADVCIHARVGGGGLTSMWWLPPRRRH
jgi:hypothetical protein